MRKVTHFGLCKDTTLISRGSGWAFLVILCKVAVMFQSQTVNYIFWSIHRMNTSTSQWQSQWMCHPVENMKIWTLYFVSMTCFNDSRWWWWWWWAQCWRWWWGGWVNFSDSMNSFIQKVLIWLVQIVPKLMNWPNFYFFQLYFLTVHLLKVMW